MSATHPVRSTWLLSASVLALLGLLVAYPTFSVLIKSLQPKGAWSLLNYFRLLNTPSLHWLLGKSILVSIGSASAATLLGTLIAVIVVKTRAPLRRLFAFTAVLPVIIPGFITSIAYIFLFGRNGLITYKWLGISWQVYSWKSVFILQSVDQTTTAFLLVAAGLLRVGSGLEEAARILGAGDWHILRTVTLQLTRPMWLAAFLLNFMRAMGDFGTPLVVGGPFDTLASASYTQLIGSYNLSMSATLNVVLFLFTMGVYAWYCLLEKQHEGSEISWRIDRPAPLDLSGPKAWPGWLVGLAFSLFVLALLAAVFLAAFTRQIGSNFSLSLEHFRTIAERGLASTCNTFFFALTVGLLVSFSGQGLAYMIKRMRVVGKSWLDFLATLPFALPGTFIGVGYAIAFNSRPLLLSGTWFIVVMNLVTRKLPLGLRAGAGMLVRQDRSLEDASFVLGGSLMRTFLRVVLPNLKPALLLSGLYAFVTTIQALGSIIFIITPGTRLLSVDVFEAVVRGEIGCAAAYSTLMLLMGVVGAAGLLAVASYSGNYLVTGTSGGNT